jgi:hypothetical protein
VLGLGMGMVMQVLVIAVQNAVDYRDLGVATSGATLFRFVGGSVGTAVLGAVFSARLTTALRDVMPPGAAFNPSGMSLEKLNALPAPAHAAYTRAFAHATDTVFLIACIVAAIGVVLALMLPETPLRATVAARASQVGEEMGEAFAMPSSPEAIDELLHGLRIIADRDVQRQYIQRVVERAGLSLSPISAWLLLRIERHGSVDAEQLERENAVPAERTVAGLGELLEANLARRMSDGGHARWELTPAGDAALEKLVAARRVRLEELAIDWPDERRAEVAARLKELAKELVPPRSAA